MVTFIHKRLAGAVGAAVLCGLACLGVPSAAAEELLPTPAETSTVTTPTDEAVAPTIPDPSDGQTSEGTGPGAEESPAPTEEPAQPAGCRKLQPQSTVRGGAWRTNGRQQTRPGPRRSSLAAAADGGDPRAYVGDVNCNDPTVPLTLDNSRSTEAVFLQVLVEADGERDPAWTRRVSSPPVPSRS